MNDLIEYINISKKDSVGEYVKQPQKINKNDNKPFEIYVNEVLVYSLLTPIDKETVPLITKYNKWIGDPNEAQLQRVLSHM